jgi:hypothetical protein
MDYIKLSNNFFWQTIASKPGVYHIYSLDPKNKPKKLHRLIGKDEEGILYIGKSENLRERLRMLWRVLNPDLKATAHTFGEKYNTYQVLKLNFPLNTLAIKFSCSNNAKELEIKLIDEYINNFGEVPPFNSTK